MLVSGVTRLFILSVVTSLVFVAFWPGLSWTFQLLAVWVEFEFWLSKFDKV